MDTFLTNSDNTLPAAADKQAYGTQQLAPVGVNPSTARLLVDAVVSGSTAAGNATLVGTTKTVAATGTPAALGTGTAREVFIYPLRTNTGAVYWGTEATNDTQHGILPIIITAPQGKLVNLAGIYIDVTVNGEGVRYITVN